MEAEQTGRQWSIVDAGRKYIIWYENQAPIVYVLPSDQIERLRPMKPWLRLTLITMTVGGGFTGFVLTFQSLLNPQSQQPAYFVFMTAFLAFYAFVTISGLLFVQNPRRTRLLLVALVLQIPWISSPLIAYQFTAGFHVTVGLIGGSLIAEFWLGSYWQFSLFQELSWGAGVNLFALLMLVLLGRSRRPTSSAPDPPIHSLRDLPRMPG